MLLSTPSHCLSVTSHSLQGSKQGWHSKHRNTHTDHAHHKMYGCPHQGLRLYSEYFIQIMFSKHSYFHTHQFHTIFISFYQISCAVHKNLLCSCVNYASWCVQCQAWQTELKLKMVFNEPANDKHAISHFWQTFKILATWTIAINSGT